jgi:hypothetical protein
MMCLPITQNPSHSHETFIQKGIVNGFGVIGKDTIAAEEFSVSGKPEVESSRSLSLLIVTFKSAVMRFSIGTIEHSPQQL